MPRDTVYAPVDPAEDILAEFPQMHTVDTADWFCTDEACPPIIGNIYVYRDTDHLSNEYLKSLTDPLREEVLEFLEAEDVV